MSQFARIVSDPAVLDGQPCLLGQRLTVRRVLEALTTYPNREELRKGFSELPEDDIRQALEYAATCLADRVLEIQ